MSGGTVQSSPQVAFWQPFGKTAQPERAAAEPGSVRGVRTAGGVPGVPERGSARVREGARAPASAPLYPHPARNVAGGACTPQPDEDRRRDSGDRWIVIGANQCHPEARPPKSSSSHDPPQGRRTYSRPPRGPSRQPAPMQQPRPRRTSSYRRAFGTGTGRRPTRLLLSRALPLRATWRLMLGPSALQAVVPSDDSEWPGAQDDNGWVRCDDRSPSNRPEVRDLRSGWVRDGERSPVGSMGGLDRHPADEDVPPLLPPRPGCE